MVQVSFDPPSEIFHFFFVGLIGRQLLFYLQVCQSRYSNHHLYSRSQYSRNRHHHLKSLTACFFPLLGHMKGFPYRISQKLLVFGFCDRYPN
jgi:hypothetical protein